MRERASVAINNVVPRRSLVSVGTGRCVFVRGARSRDLYGVECHGVVEHESLLFVRLFLGNVLVCYEYYLQVTRLRCGLRRSILSKKDGGFGLSRYGRPVNMGGCDPLRIACANNYIPTKVNGL